MDASVNSKGGASTASSRHTNGVNMALCDGAIRFVNEEIVHDVWWALGSIQGGETVPDAL